MQRFLLILFLFSILQSVAQSPDDILPHGPMNEAYLEHLIKEGIDSVRLEHGLDGLVNDSLLWVAAKAHARYLDSLKILSHYEEGIAHLYDPQSRVEHRGGRGYLVGENVALLHYGGYYEDKKGVTHPVKTYGQLAKEMVRIWVYSKPHYENMRTPEYDVTGLAVQIDPGTKECRAVQKFADLPNTYVHRENKEMFSFSDWQAPPPLTDFLQGRDFDHRTRFEHRIRPPKDSLAFCAECNLAVDTASYHTRIITSGRRIQLVTQNVDMMHELISRRKDGLALEVVNYLPFDCRNPAYYSDHSRRSRSCLFSGRVLEPVYKRQLKKGFKRSKYKWYFRKKRKRDSEYFKVTLGRLPKDLNGLYEFNLLILKRNRICRAMHFSNYCGSPLERLWPVEPILDTVENDFVWNTSKGGMNFEVPFEQSRSTFEYKDIEPIIKAVASSSFSVDSARVQAFASVEGDSVSNLKLVEQRGRNLLDAIASQQEEAFPYRIEKAENWELFRTQALAEKAFKEWYDLSKGEVKQRLAAPEAQQRVEGLLSQQRKARVELDVQFTYSGEELARFLIGRFSQYESSLLKMEGELDSEKARNYMDTLRSIHSYLYALAIQDSIPYQSYLGLRIDPKNPDYALWESMMWGKAQVSKKEALPVGEWIHAPLLRTLIEGSGRRDFQMEYDLAVMDFHGLEQSKQWVPASLEKFEARLKGLVESAGQPEEVEAQSALRLLAEFYALQLSRDTTLDKFDAGTTAQYKLTKKLVATLDLLPQDKKVDLMVASHCLRADFEDLAYPILMGYYLGGDRTAEVLSPLAKVSYEHREEIGHDEYSKWLMELKEFLSDEEWCGMFDPECGISFQIMDLPEFRDFYCEICDQLNRYRELLEVEHQ